MAETGLRLLQRGRLARAGQRRVQARPARRQLKLIECNVRFTAVNELIARSGLDLANLVYRRQLGEAVELPARARDGVYMWWPIQDTIACILNHRRGELSLSDWARSLAQRQHLPMFAWRDPAPSAAGLYWMGMRAGRQLRRRRPRAGPGSRCCGRLTGASAMTPRATVTIPAERLSDLLQRAFRGVGLDAVDAAAVSEVLVDANLRGIDSHGLERAPIYLRRVHAGLAGGSGLMVTRADAGGMVWQHAGGAWARWPRCRRPTLPSSERACTASPW